jgi:alpha-glucosidase
MSAFAQRDDPHSTLSLYRRALRLRRERLGPAELRWHSAASDDHLAFTRAGVLCVANLGLAPIDVPAAAPLVASGPIPTAGQLPPDTAAWWLID